MSRFGGWKGGGTQEFKSHVKLEILLDMQLSGMQVCVYTHMYVHIYMHTYICHT